MGYKYDIGDEVIIDFSKIKGHSCPSCGLWCPEEMLKLHGKIAVIIHFDDYDGTYSLDEKEGEDYKQMDPHDWSFCEHILIPANNEVEEKRRINYENKI